jgi:hypothetical protein
LPIAAIVQGRGYRAFLINHIAIFVEDIRFIPALGSPPVTVPLHLTYLSLDISTDWVFNCHISVALFVSKGSSI